MRTNRINAGAGYDVLIGSGLLKTCGEIIKERVNTCRIAVITDSNVEKLYLQTVLKSLYSAGFSVCAYTFPCGERSKTMATLAEILEYIASEGLTRSDAVVALGGGVVGDISGFAAGCYMRGIKFIQVPTSLLAAVDSSVGGKTAVDLTSGKNLAGLFLQPSVVICDTGCLKTLPEKEMKNGLAEAIKTAILTGGSLFDAFETGNTDMESIIAQCVAYKGGVTERDEFEKGERKLLNLGHTVGHAIELLSRYSIPHGMAVSSGLAIISRSSARLGWCGKDTAQRIVNILKKNTLPTSSVYSAKTLSAVALHDKKRDCDTITLAIPEKIGGCVLKDISVSQLESIIALGLEDL